MPKHAHTLLHTIQVYLAESKQLQLEAIHQNLPTGRAYDMPRRLEKKGSLQN